MEAFGGYRLLMAGGGGGLSNRRRSARVGERLVALSAGRAMALEPESTWPTCCRQCWFPTADRGSRTMLRRDAGWQHRGGFSGDHGSAWDASRTMSRRYKVAIHWVFMVGIVPESADRLATGVLQSDSSDIDKARGHCASRLPSVHQSIGGTRSAREPRAPAVPRR
jgi:hypothetical protein